MSLVRRAENRIACRKLGTGLGSMENTCSIALIQKESHDGLKLATVGKVGDKMGLYAQYTKMTICRWLGGRKTESPVES